MNQEYLYGVSLLTSKKNWYFKHLLNKEKERGFTVLDQCWLLLIKLIWFDYLTNYDLDGYLISINTHNQYGMQIKCKNIKDTSIWLWRKILTKKKKKKPSKGISIALQRKNLLVKMKFEIYNYPILALHEQLITLPLNLQ